MLNDGGGNHKAHVIGGGDALKGDADDFAVLNDRAAGVAGVDGGIGLDNDVGIGLRVAVNACFNTRYDAFGNGDLLAAHGEAAGLDGGFDARDAAEG